MVVDSVRPRVIVVVEVAFTEVAGATMLVEPTEDAEVEMQLLLVGCEICALTDALTEPLDAGVCSEDWL
jgi:hypothetical protein